MIRPSSLPLMFAGLMAGAVSPAVADLVVLQYHHVSDSTPPSTSTTVSLFEDQLDMIGELGLEVVPLESGTRQALAGELDTKQQIAITFDDAYDSVYHTAAPLLAEKGFPYTVFVNTDGIGGRGYMTWDQLKEFAADPLVTIANHSKDHDHMVQRPGEDTDDWRERIRINLDGAQSVLKAKLSTDTPMFAYPYGEFSRAVEAMVDDRGWYGYGQQSGAVGSHSHDTRMPRFPVADAYGQLDNLKPKLTSRAFPVAAEKLPDGVINENPPTLSFVLPESMDAARLNCFASGQGRVDFAVDSDGRFTLTAPEPFNSRRFRYNCTYPAGNGTFYWLSQQWLDLSRPED